MPNPKKEKFVNELVANLQDVPLCILTDYKGLNVEELTVLREKLKQVGYTYRVVKNTLAKIAVKKLSWNNIAEYFSGPVAIVYGNGDVVDGAKITFNYSKINNNLKIKAGIIEGKFVSGEQIKYLATLPSREVLLTQCAIVMVSPLRNFINALHGLLSKFVWALNALKNQKTKDRKNSG